MSRTACNSLGLSTHPGNAGTLEGGMRFRSGGGRCSKFGVWRGATRGVAMWVHIVPPHGKRRVGRQCGQPRTPGQVTGRGREVTFVSDRRRGAIKLRARLAGPRHALARWGVPHALPHPAASARRVEMTRNSRCATGAAIFGVLAASPAAAIADSGPVSPGFAPVPPSSGQAATVQLPASVLRCLVPAGYPVDDPTTVNVPPTGDGRAPATTTLGTTPVP